MNLSHQSFSGQKWAVVVFCLVHATVIALASVPVDIGFIHRFTWKYVELTALKQHWHLFAPDPPLLVERWSIEQLQDDEWSQLTTIDPTSVARWERAPLLQVVRLIHDDRYNFIKQNILAYQCDHFDLTVQTALRLRSTTLDIRTQEEEQKIVTSHTCAS